MIARQLTSLKGFQGQSDTARRPPSRPTRCRALSVRTPHSGYHYDDSGRRFFEGWYFKVTLDGPGNAFALIYSIEDPAGGSPNQGVGAQIMGPDDSYLCQFSPNTDAFWAESEALELGASFVPKRLPQPDRRLPEAEFDAAVEYGYQASQTWHQGKLCRSDAGAKGKLPTSVDSASWAFSVRPVLGWGSPFDKQKSTAGWLASLPVFEPHWQLLDSHRLPCWGVSTRNAPQGMRVMMALGRASGWIEWGGKRHEFQDAPAYAEKNWGGGFPKKWFWVQCDRYVSEALAHGAHTSSTTARDQSAHARVVTSCAHKIVFQRLLMEKRMLGTSSSSCQGIVCYRKAEAPDPALGSIIGDVEGALRGVLSLPLDEEVGLVGLHWGDQFHEFVPWSGDVSWAVAPWGSWRVAASNATHRVLVEAICARPGTPLRAPTADNGLAPLCKDSFFGEVRVRLWTKGTDYGGGELLLLDAKSDSAAVEVGGGPWFETWESRAQMREPLKSIVGVPLDVESIAARLPRNLRPRGL